jgi:hypothetical protein
MRSDLSLRSSGPSLIIGQCEHFVARPDGRGTALFNSFLSIGDGAFLTRKVALPYGEREAREISGRCDHDLIDG